MSSRTHNSGVQASLKAFVGSVEMGVVDTRANEKALELSRGRKCHNCGNFLLRYVPIPTAQSFVCICEDCMFHMLGLKRVASEEQEPDPVDVFVATHSLMGVLASTHE